MMNQERITPDYLRSVISRIVKQVENAGFTQIQLCREAGIKYNNLSKMKNPKINTVIKIIEAKDRLLKKRK